MTAILTLMVATLNYTVRWKKRDKQHFTETLKGFPRPIMICWHDQLIAFPKILGLGKPCSSLCSSHADGRFLGLVMRCFGYRTIWGSSNRQPTASLRAMAREINQGRIFISAPDGPRGPSQVLAMGPIALAQLTGAPIIPVAWRGTAQWRVKSWDRMRFMKPFSSATIVYGEPIFLEKKKSREEIELQRLQVENALKALNTQLEIEFSEYEDIK